MAAASNKISMRMDTKDLAAIQGTLDDFGCKNISEFLRMAASEKLDRKKVSGFVEQQIARIEERQKLLDTAIALLLKSQDSVNKNAVKTIEKIGDNLNEIANAITKNGVK